MSQALLGVDTGRGAGSISAACPKYYVVMMIPRYPGSLRLQTGTYDRLQVTTVSLAFKLDKLLLLDVDHGRVAKTRGTGVAGRCLRISSGSRFQVSNFKCRTLVPWHPSCQFESPRDSSCAALRLGEFLQRPHRQRFPASSRDNRTPL